MSIAGRIAEIEATLPEGVQLVVVSKTRSQEEIMEAYAAGHRVFGENRVLDMVDKFDALPKDIRWHMIGHVQSNKVKHMAPFVDLIHGIDSAKLFEEVNRQAQRYDRVVDVLLQLHVAKEDTKYGFRPEDINDFIISGAIQECTNVRIRGIMGMATNTPNEDQVATEFGRLKLAFNHLKKGHFRKWEHFDILSMGMSGDYHIALELDATMVRVGSAIFGPRKTV